MSQCCCWCVIHVSSNAGVGVGILHTVGLKASKIAWDKFWAQVVNMVVKLGMVKFDWSNFSYESTAGVVGHGQTSTIQTQTSVLSFNLISVKIKWVFREDNDLFLFRKLISSSFHRLDMTLAVAEALNPNKPNLDMTLAVAEALNPNKPNQNYSMFIFYYFP